MLKNQFSYFKHILGIEIQTALKVAGSICCRTNIILFLKLLWNMKDQSVRGLHTNLCVFWDSRSNILGKVAHDRFPSHSYK